MADWLRNDGPSPHGTRGKKRKPVWDAFHERIKKARNGCWNWTGLLGRWGYAKLQFRDRQLGASKVGWILYGGEVPAGMFVCHKCDNPKCVNPKHLFIGTPKDNTQDAIRKGRMLVGEKNGQHKLTAKQVIKIRERRKRGETLLSIANDFGVKMTAIHKIVHRDHWKHIP